MEEKNVWGADGEEVRYETSTIKSYPIQMNKISFWQYFFSLFGFSWVLSDSHHCILLSSVWYYRNAIIQRCQKTIFKA